MKQRRLPAKRLALIGVVIGACILLFVTEPHSYGDTSVYAADVLASLHKTSSGFDPLWEFGHLLWRPAGLLTWRLTRPLTSLYLGADPYLQIFAAFVLLNHAFALAAVFLLYAIGVRCGLSGFRAAVLPFVVILTNAVLNYIQAGTAYVPGLVFQLAAVYLLLGHVRPAMLSVVPVGLAMAGSVLCWFVYILTVPAVLLFGYTWRQSSRVSDPGRLRALIVSAFVAGGAILLCYGVVIVAKDLTTPEKCWAWYQDASHGVSQNRKLLRLGTGLPRAFINMGDTGTLLKQYVFRDPYATVSLADLLRRNLWKLPLVGLAVLALLAVFCRSRDRWRVLTPFLVGSIPVVAFAVTLFEPSQDERYLPFFSLLVPLIAVALREWNRRKAVDIVLLGCFLIIAAVNVSGYGTRMVKEVAIHKTRLLDQELSAKDRVVVLSYSDELSAFAVRYPFHPVRRQRPLPLYHLIEPMSAKPRMWREEFGAMALRTWNSDGDVWLSRRLNSTRPLPEAAWVEGDNPALRWADIVTFFREFQTDKVIGDDDGFTRLARTAANRARLSSPDSSADGTRSKPQP